MRLLPELSIVVPTLNEVDNVPMLLERLMAVRSLPTWEIIFVDDNSSDGTARAIGALAMSEPRIRLLQRPTQQGLASASIAGMRAALGVFIVVMDADGQHDETVITTMLEQLRHCSVDLVIASRHHAGASMGTIPMYRKALSAAGTWLLGFLLREAALTDPLSGFFMIRAALFAHVQVGVSENGFKTLVNILDRLPPATRMVELPYRFRPREHGRSKVTLLLVMHCVCDILVFPALTCYKRRTYCDQ